MFGSSKSTGKVRPEILSASLNTIAKGTVVTGDIQSEGIIRIDGTVKGKIRSKAKIAVGKSGHIEGEIWCDEADVEGQVTGKVHVVNRLTIRSQGKVNGDIQTGKLVVEPGAQFNGTCSMGAQIKAPHVDREGTILTKEAV
jgi:cytoskeletal protein CcmA (bactofilin family)